MTSSDTTLQMKKFIKAKPERVFAAWTQPGLIKQWFAPGTMTVQETQADARVGGAYKIAMLGEEASDMPGLYVTEGKYTEIVPNRKLVFTWGWAGPERHESIVTVEFMEKDGGTELVLTHERLLDADSVQRHSHGWIGCLVNLEARIATMAG
jgi:uncharacterized protein YndB with AHSA1/START domain